MKKIFLGLSLIATLVLVSCKTETKNKIEDASEAVKTEMGEAIDTAAAKVGAAIDSSKVKAGKTLEKGAKKMNEAGEEIEEDVKN
jgi:hypothetical protein